MRVIGIQYFYIFAYGDNTIVYLLEETLHINKSKHLSSCELK